MFWLQGREGFAFGRFNNDGYNNLFQYEENMQIQILICGSSHMQANHVMQDEITASVLSTISGRTVYNIGISGQSFAPCAEHLDAALKKYKPREYAVIEIFGTKFSEEYLLHIINNKEMIRPPKLYRGISALIRNNNFIRLMFHKFFTDSPEQKNNTFENPNYNVLLAEVLSRLEHTASSHGVRLIIAYHPSISLNKDGSISIDDDASYVKQFSDLCAQNGIYFLNMSDRFLNEYAKDYTLPYGFRNTSVGKGHLNKYGHRMFAEEIYKLIQRIEAQS